MKKLLSIVLTLLTSIQLIAQNTYHLGIEGFDWGPNANKVVVPLGDAQKSVLASDFQVFVKRSSTIGDIPAEVATGKRDVITAFISDEKGNKVESGNHATLILEVGPTLTIASPIQYFRSGGNKWIDYQLTILHPKSGQIWNKEASRSLGLTDKFDVSGTFKHNDISLTYGVFKPETNKDKIPLMIWLHGGGEGGTDPTIAIIGNKVSNYASDEIQTIFEGAYVLAPQTPTRWMHSVSNGTTSGKENDIYNEALMALIKDFVKNNPKVDASRIYIGGCSNGGYMSLKLILLNPDYFAAGYISALAYKSEFVSDAEIQKIKNVPIWFVHSKDDNTTKPNETVVPLYNRLKAAGAKNTYMSLYDHVTDVTGVYGGEQFQYMGHWSWIYSHANKANKDADGRPVKVNGKPVNIMEWLAAQKLPTVKSANKKK